MANIFISDTLVAISMNKKIYKINFHLAFSEKGYCQLVSTPAAEFTILVDCKSETSVDMKRNSLPGKSASN